MNRHALGENPLARRRDSILRNTERLETADESLTSSNAVSAGAVTAGAVTADDDSWQITAWSRPDSPCDISSCSMISVIKSGEQQGTNSIVLRSSGC